MKIVIVSLLSYLCVGIVGFHAVAQTTRTWTGASSPAVWTDPGNWSPAGVPGSSDIVQFNNGAPVLISTFASNQIIGQLFLSNNTRLEISDIMDRTLTIAGGSGIDLDVPTGCSLKCTTVGGMGIIISMSGLTRGTVGGSLVIDKELVLGTWSIVDLSGTLTVTTLGRTTNSGSVNILSGGTMAVEGLYTGNNISSMTVANQGTLSINGTATLNNAGVTVNAGGSATVTGSLNLGTSTASCTINGTMTVSGSGTVSTGSAAANSVTVGSGGTLAMRDETLVSGSGSLTVSSGGRLEIGSANGIAASGATGNIQTATRTFHVGGHYVYNRGGSQNTGTGLPNNLTGRLLVNNPGNTVTLDNARTIASSGTVDLTAGTLAAGTNLTMSTGSIVTTAAGALTGTPQGTGSYSVTYNGSSKFCGSELGGSGLKDITLALTAGETLTLGQARAMSGTLTLTSGTITTTATNILTIGASGSVSGGSSTSFINGPLAHTVASTVGTTKTFPIGAGSHYRPVELTVTQDAATSTIYIAELINTSPAGRTLPPALTNVSTQRHHRVTKGAGAGITNGQIKISYDVADAVTDPTNLRIAKDDGAGNWIDIGGTGTSAGTGTITSTINFTSFSDFVLANGSGGGNPLPVELTSLSGTWNDRTITLRWRTATEKNNFGFSVERSLDGRDWIEIGFVSGHGTVSSPHSYMFTDVFTGASSLPSGFLHYRLRQMDRDGKFTYSPVVTLARSAESRPRLLEYHPNPALTGSMINVSFSIPDNAPVTLTLFDALGRVVARFIDQVEYLAGTHVVPMSAAGLARGLYLVRLDTPSSSDQRPMIVDR